MNRAAPVEITYDCVRLLIMHPPHHYHQRTAVHGVHTLVRACLWNKKAYKTWIGHLMVVLPLTVLLDWDELLFSVALALIERRTEHEDVAHFIRLTWSVQLSSCFTWKTTSLNCVCAPEMPTDRAALYTVGIYNPIHVHSSFVVD